MPENTESQRPSKEFKSGSLTAAIWRNETVQDGRTVVRHSVKLQKRFLDSKTGEWRDSAYWFEQDLPRVRMLVEQCYEWIALRESDDDEFPPAVA